jgi:hypothetical protein
MTLQGLSGVSTQLSIILLLDDACTSHTLTTFCVDGTCVMSRCGQRCHEATDYPASQGSHGSHGIACISGHLRASQGISGHLRASQGISGHRRASHGIAGHRRASQDIPGLAGHYKASQGITGHHRESQGITGHHRALTIQVYVCAELHPDIAAHHDSLVSSILIAGSVAEESPGES